LPGGGVALDFRAPFGGEDERLAGDFEKIISREQQKDVGREP
jgi:hypothetical protein